MRFTTGVRVYRGSRSGAPVQAALNGKDRRSGGSVRRSLPDCSPRPTWPGTHTAVRIAQWYGRYPGEQTALNRSNGQSFQRGKWPGLDHDLGHDRVHAPEPDRAYAVCIAENGLRRAPSSSRPGGGNGACTTAADHTGYRQTFTLRVPVSGEGPLYTSELRRDVAQPGSAPALGAGGRRFESARPDGIAVGVGNRAWAE